jgi:hypothetical protein
MALMVSGSSMRRPSANSALKTARQKSSPQGWASPISATRAARILFCGNGSGRRIGGKERSAQTLSRSRHILRPLAGKRLKGEVVQPCTLKIGPSRNGRNLTSTPAALARARTRMAAG